MSIRIIEGEPDVIEILTGPPGSAAPGGGGGTWGAIGGTLSAQTDLQDALNLKLNASLISAYGLTLAGAADAAAARAVLDLGSLALLSSLAISDVTGLQTALDGKQAAGSYAAASHLHAIADTTGLQAALDAKAGLAANSFTGAQSIASGTLTASAPALDITQTWNNAAVTFRGALINVTDTASASASTLFDVQLAGANRLSVRKDGTVSIGGSAIQLFVPGNIGLLLGNDAFSIRIGSSGAANDLVIVKDAANTFGLRNGVNAQTGRFYRTFTDASNFQRLTLGWSTSTALVMNEGLGTGADGSVAFNDAALATSATRGFIMIASCAGIPSGVPADIPTGQIPVVYDTANNRIYAYNGSWRQVAVS